MAQLGVSAAENLRGRRSAMPTAKSDRPTKLPRRVIRPPTHIRWIFDNWPRYPDQRRHHPGPPRHPQLYRHRPQARPRRPHRPARTVHREALDAPGSRPGL